MKDKIAHAVFGWIISLALGGLFQNVVIGLLGGCLAGIIKEVVWDKWLNKGTPELLDFVATCIGAILGLIMLLPARF
ncbi:MAG TPA: hypothetical protein ENN47_07580 [Mesotoga infera]|uniref:Uncharacterized protein n=1 Tax=Mesotoga infera TaxID=1236046 RepID=A0A7C1CWL0_9BACT|nr:hypothetical protein [Mesotoga infera]